MYHSINANENERSMCTTIYIYRTQKFSNFKQKKIVKRVSVNFLRPSNTDNFLFLIKFTCSKTKFPSSSFSFSFLSFIVIRFPRKQIIVLLSPLFRFKCRHLCCVSSLLFFENGRLLKYFHIHDFFVGRNVIIFY
jgi:hypothetical protein